MSYPFAAIEPKWQRYWEEHATFASHEDPARPKLYILDMYPYPSGAGLHVGHPEGYTATDIYARYRRMRGTNVLHPMGWDAFGLPAEQYAMKTNIHPRVTTANNIATFRRQIKMLGLSYDWEREVDTTDPSYYKWTQWIFLRIYSSWFDPRAGKARPVADLEAELAREGSGGIPGAAPLSPDRWRALDARQKGEYLAPFRLAYIAEVPVNWCEALGTVLANEEVAEWNEKGYTVERRPMRQWMMRITAYADRLLADLDEIDWPPSTLEQQRNWIGRSEGAMIDFPVDGAPALRVFTTRPDTIFGATFLVAAPEHPALDALTAPAERAPLEAYRAQARRKSDLERGAQAGKSGVFTGAFAVNPATGSRIPVWAADYVLMGYGTGAIMGVPGQDERDWAFAETYNLPIVRTVRPPEGWTGKAYTGEGAAINSTAPGLSLEGLSVAEAKERTIAWLGRGKLGERAVQYKLRDWLFSRQRYWGEPIPIIHWEDGTMSEVTDLPLLLPELKTFQPSGTTESPLALAREWVEVTDPATGRKGRRETNTMPQWAGSCWYYLRFCDPHNPAALCSEERQRYWLPVDLYVGGAEHAVLHLMYARFWHKVLYDLGHVGTKEPFARLRHQGIILGEDSRKMSKARGNVVNPDDIVARYGADSLRLFEMFMGPLTDAKPWSTHGVEGIHRFLNRAWRMIAGDDEAPAPVIADDAGALDEVGERLLHQTIRKVTEDVESLSFNTAIAQMMIFVNEFLNRAEKPRAAMEAFVLLLAPFAPHLCEELWERLGHGGSLAYAPWPAFDPAKAAEAAIEIPVQVNGKVRGKFTAARGADDASLRSLALAEPGVKKHLDGKEIVKVVVVKDRLVSIVIR